MSAEKVKPRLTPNAISKVTRAISAAAKTMDLPLITPKVAALTEVTRSYEDIQGRVLTVEGGIARQGEAAAESTTKIKVELKRLGGFLVADGLPSQQPIKPLRFKSLARIARMPVQELADETARLAKTVLAHPGLSQFSRDSAVRLGELSEVLGQALAPVQGLENERNEAIHEREALAIKWKSHLDAVKHAARMADAEGEKDVYKTLFSGIETASPRPRMTKPPAPPPPAPAPASMEEATATAPEQPPRQG